MPTNWNDAPKDPEAIRDYAMDWTADIGEATITDQTWEVVDGDVQIVQDGLSDDLKTTIVRLSGGTAGQTCHIKNHVVLSTGEEDEYTGVLVIAQR